MFIVYILYSSTIDKFYIGFTADDVNIRLQKYLSNHNGFTARVKDWKIVFTEIFSTKTEAINREKQLKNWKSKKELMNELLVIK